MMENYGVKLKVDDIDKFMGRAHASGGSNIEVTPDGRGYPTSTQHKQQEQQHIEEPTEPASTENKPTYIYQASDSNRGDPRPMVGDNIYPGIKYYIRMGDDGMIKVKIVFLVISVSLLILSSILITKNVVNKKVK